MKNLINQRIKEKTHLWKCRFCGAINGSTKNKIAKEIESETYEIVDFDQDGLIIKSNLLPKKEQKLNIRSSKKIKCNE